MEYNKALSKCMQMCSRKEYCTADIKEKLYNWEISDINVDKIINALIDQKFLNEERFVRAYVNDKIKFNHWGRKKISFYLKSKGVDSKLINTELAKLDEQEYEKIVKIEIEKKLPKIKAKSDYERNGKLVNYLASKGFESDLVFKTLEKLKLDN